VQVQTVGRTIPPGADEEWCEVVELPGSPDDTYFFGRLELAMAPFSHHVIVSFTPEPSARLEQEPLGTPVQCNGAHAFGSLLTLGASAKTYTTSQLPVDHIDKQARIFGFYNQDIEIPPHTSRSFVEECTFTDEVFIWSLARHTHRRGTDFQVWWVGGERDSQHLWTSTDWEQDINYRFDEPVVMQAGTGFRWECAFDNPTDETLIFGQEATDEMCILFGQYVGTGEVDSVAPQSCYRFAR
jgi:hypothetical protein